VLVGDGGGSTGVLAEANQTTHAPVSRAQHHDYAQDAQQQTVTEKKTQWHKWHLANISLGAR
jgi:hypothetical protein